MSYMFFRLHFEDIYERYGSPCLVFNLIRQTEPPGKERECILGPPFGIYIST